MNDSTIIALDIPASIFLMVLVYKAITIQKARGMTLWLLVGLTSAITMLASFYIFQLVADYRLIEANSSELHDAFLHWLKIYDTLLGLSMVTNLLIDNVHWTFAFKYWTLACKLERIKLGQNPNTFNQRYVVIFVIGIVLTSISAILPSLIFW